MRCELWFLRADSQFPFQTQCSPGSMFKVPACSLGGPIVVAPLSPISEFVLSNLRSAQEGKSTCWSWVWFPGSLWTPLQRKGSAWSGRQ